MEIQYIFVLILFCLVELSKSSLRDAGEAFIEERYICGGHSGIRIASGTNFRVTPSSRDLNDAFAVMLRKTKWIAIHTRSLITEFYRNQRIHENQPEFTEIPNCLHSFDIDDTMDIQSHMEILSDVVGVLSRMKEEEDEHEYGYFSHKLKAIRSSVEQLMCQQYIAIGMLGQPLPNRNIVTTTSKWCRATCTASRYERDNFLLKRIKLLVDNLHEKYHQNRDNIDNLD